MARQKKNKGKETGKGYRPLSTAGQGFEALVLPVQQRDHPYRAIPIVAPIRARHRHPAISHGVSRGRRVLLPFGVDDPQEARAVPESVFAGTILERIMYKRNLILFGPPSLNTWLPQYVDNRVNSLLGGVRLDFVYFVNRPPCVIEPQGRHWHGPFERPGDNLRGFFIFSLGYRYTEIWEEDVLGRDDAWLDRTIMSLVGGTVNSYDNFQLTLPRELSGIVRGTFVFKEDALFI